MKKKEIIQTLWSSPQLTVDGYLWQTCKMNGFEVIRFDFTDYLLYRIQVIDFYFPSLSALHAFVTKYSCKHSFNFWYTRYSSIYSQESARLISSSHPRLWSLS